MRGVDISGMAYWALPEYDWQSQMDNVIRFPKRHARIPIGPLTIYVCAPSYEDMEYTQKKFGLGYSRQGAKVDFYGGDPQIQHILARTFTLKSAPNRLKFVMVNQLEVWAHTDHAFSPVEEEARKYLGNDAYRYCPKGPRRPKPKRLDKLFG